MRYSLACLSNVGVARRHNEDNFAFFGKVMQAEHQSSAVYAADAVSSPAFATGVFDGMGGEVNGENASYVAAKVFEDNASRERWTRDDIVNLFTEMEAAVCRERDAKRAKVMGTTATILVVDNDHAYVANVGDSPAILYSNGKLITLSDEHTDAEILRLLGVTGRKPGLTQFLGMSDGELSPSPYVVDFEVSAGDAILLASDGLTESLDSEAILSALDSAGETSDRVKLLCDLAIQGGGTDNITVLLCEAVWAEHTSEDVVE